MGKTQEPGEHQPQGWLPSLSSQAVEGLLHCKLHQMIDLQLQVMVLEVIISITLVNGIKLDFHCNTPEEEIGFIQ